MKYAESEIKKEEKFIIEISKENPENLAYIDESKMINEPYEYAYTQKGQPFKDTKTGKKKEKINVISGLINGKLVGFDYFTENCNRVIFIDWLKNCFLPQVKPKTVLILDNARFHHGEQVLQIVEAAKCRIIYLPPYSPHLNKIEQYWQPLKNNVRKILRDKNKTLEYALVQHLVSNNIF
jgi:transposase